MNILSIQKIQTQPDGFQMGEVMADVAVGWYLEKPHSRQDKTEGAMEQASTLTIREFFFPIIHWKPVQEDCRLKTESS